MNFIIPWRNFELIDGTDLLEDIGLSVEELYVLFIFTSKLKTYNYGEIEEWLYRFLDNHYHHVVSNYSGEFPNMEMLNLEMIFQGDVDISDEIYSIIGLLQIQASNIVVPYIPWLTTKDIVKVDIQRNYAVVTLSDKACEALKTPMVL